jgi:uncharacterized protein (DUF849 family)
MTNTATATSQSKAIITCAITGAVHTPTMSTALPIIPEQITKAGLEAANAGASIVHLHTRDPVDGRPTPDPAAFMRFLPEIKAGCDAILTSQRVQHVEKIRSILESFSIAVAQPGEVRSMLRLKGHLRRTSDCSCATPGPAFTEF